MNTSAATATLGDEGELDGAATIGSELRQQRETRGYTLADVEAYLRIRHSYLEAIEAGQFSDLPGTTYVVGFIRSYARFLELDADDIVDRVRACQSQQKQVPYKLVLPGPAKYGKLAVVAIPLVATAAVVLAIAGWYYFSSNNLSITDLGGIFEDSSSAVPEVTGPRPQEGESKTADVASSAAEPGNNPVRSATSSPETAGQADERIQADGTGAAPAIDAGEAQVAAVPPDPAGSGTTAPPVPQPADGIPAASPAEVPPNTASPAEAPSATTPPAEAPSAAAAPAEAPLAAAPPVAAPAEAPRAVASTSEPVAQPAAPADESATSQVLLQATGETFIALRTPDGEIFLSRLLRAGEIYEIPPENPALTLDTGNAGALQIVVDGRALPPLGAVGAVVRDIPLDPQGLLERNR